jgi:hypothetical protein
MSVLARTLLARTLLTLLLVPAVACDPAAGREATVSMRLSSSRRDGGPPRRFTTAAGWDVTLEEARIALGPIYLYENAPADALNEHWWRLDRLVLPVARAHAGDQQFSGGAVLAEYVGQVAFDALGAAPVDLGTTTATVARARSFSVRLDPPSATNREATRGHHLWARGQAAKDGATIAFEGGLDLAQAGTQRRVDGLDLEADLDDGGTFTLVVHPEAWFDQADFSSLPAPAEGGTRVIGAESQVRGAWFVGARGYRAFTGGWAR